MVKKTNKLNKPNKPNQTIKEEINIMKAKVRCIVPYWDLQLNPSYQKIQEKGAEWIVDKERADYLIGLGLVELVECFETKEEAPTDEETPVDEEAPTDEEAPVDEINVK